MRRATAIVASLAWLGAWVGCTVSPSGSDQTSNNDNTNDLQYWGADAGFYGSGPPGGEFGATQGGVQDMSLARELVAQGRVPPPEAFVVEAMFSEHDLPIAGPPCQTTLCLRAAMGIAPAIPISRDQQFQFSHAGGFVELLVSYLLTRDIKLTAAVGYSGWFTLSEDAEDGGDFHSYFGPRFGIGAVFKY